MTRVVLMWCMCWVCLNGAELIDRGIIDDPQRADIDATSMARWERLFAPDQRWIGRDLAFLETHNAQRIVTLYAARLLYRGNPWSRRIFISANERWRDTDRDVRLTVLRFLRSYRNAELAGVYGAFLDQETDPQLARQALINFHLVDPVLATTWALRAADPRNAASLPSSQHAAVRSQALALLIETRGADNVDVRQSLAWALLNASSSERNNALHLITRGSVPDLLAQVVLRLAKEFRAETIDAEGRFALILASTRMTGAINQEQLDALLYLALKGDRALASAATTVLTSGVTWDCAIVINELVERAASDQDPVIRHTLLSLLVRLDPSAVARAAGPDSPWMRLAEHVNKLEAWDNNRAPDLGVLSK